MYKKLVQIGAILGCHQRTDRSFKFKNYQFPICARCLGIYIGNLIGLILLPFVNMNFNLTMILLFTTILDGTIQLLTKYESNNYVRIITGFLSGIALIQFFRIFLSFFLI